MRNNGRESVLPNKLFTSPLPEGSPEEEFCGKVETAEGATGGGGGRDTEMGSGLLVSNDNPGAAMSLILEPFDGTPVEVPTAEVPTAEVAVVVAVAEEEEEGRGRRGGPKSNVRGCEVSITITSFPMEVLGLEAGLPRDDIYLQ